MAKSSRRVVLAALAGNGAVALAKFAAAGISGSTAMLTEAIHSLVDTADQVLLLVGQTRGERRADATHPLGYGMKVYFWSFVVALMVFLVGGVLSMYEGVRQIPAAANLASAMAPFPARAARTTRLELLAIVCNFRFAVHPPRQSEPP